MNSHVGIDLSLSEPAEARRPEFLNLGLKPLNGLFAQFEDMHHTLEDIEAIGGPIAARQSRRMALEMDAFAPAVTFIGQIKSGKTTLVNAFAGRPGLLPADVNPWTSVVTSLHLAQLRGPDDPVATFSFFEENEWDFLVQNGGRIGELSARVGADKEHDRLVSQVAQMREKTKARLGRKFEMLLGQSHSYSSLEPGLIQRYVCLGDDFDAPGGMSDKQGLFADITKSADLYVDAPHLPLALTLRDTPGMNDTFLMREQITIRAIRESKICVVVLSAHQALSSVDMGLIRMIANVQSRQVVIFVNRIDELADPRSQILEVRDSLLRTLAQNDGPKDPKIIFGSGFWANAALTGTHAALPKASAAALENYQGLFPADHLRSMAPDARVWVLSGLPQLYSAIGERVAEGPGAQLLTHIRRRGTNVVTALRSSTNLVTLKANSDQIQKMSREEISALMERIGLQAQEQLETALATLFQSFGDRVDQAHERYTARALDALLTHLERNGDDKVWSYSADGLRVLLRGAYQVMSTKFRVQATKVLDDTALRLTEAYGQIFDVTPENFQVAAPPLPDLPPPVGLAQTIVLDVSSAWWKRWWGKRRGYRAFTNGFKELIEAETQPMVHDLKVAQTNQVREMAMALLEEFLVEQSMILGDICDKVQVSLEDLHKLFGVTRQEEREELFDIILGDLGVEEGDPVDEVMGDAA